MDKKFSITIGRQLGSGGRQIGEKLASQLGIFFYDKKLIQIASHESGLGKEFFEKVDEKTRHHFLGGRLAIFGSLGSGNYSGNYLSNERLFTIQSDVIEKLAKEKSAVFVGRCADYVLKSNPLCINIFISADMNDRIKHVSEKQNLSGKQAKELIEKMDKNRTDYYNYFSNKVWGNATSYHLCVNSSVLGIDETVNFIRQFVIQKFEL
ncbi:MAG: cytidylate kinase-like family protein [Bacteroidetes bacterium]|nr:cytidylate kinase-like family protein [Bacteroidota bacterium]